MSTHWTASATRETLENAVKILERDYKILSHDRRIRFIEAALAGSQRPKESIAYADKVIELLTSPIP